MGDNSFKLCRQELHILADTNSPAFGQTVCQVWVVLQKSCGAEILWLGIQKIG